MTIEEKARAYDEAIERANAAYKDEDRHLKAALERIFPELKESEDEKIRKALIDYFDDANKADENPLQSYGIHTDKAIAWLEKRSEPTDINPSEFDLRLNKLLKQFETLPKEELANLFTELRECEDEKNEKVRIGLIKAFNTVGKFEWGGLNVQDILAWLKSLKPQSHWKPTEEQLYMLNWLATNVLDDGVTGKPAKEVLYSLYEQLKQL